MNEKSFADALLDLNTVLCKAGLKSKEKLALIIVALRLTRETSIDKYEAVEKVVSAVSVDLALHNKITVLKNVIESKSDHALSLFFDCCICLGLEQNSC